MKHIPETIDVLVWVKRNGMLLRRDCLAADDPDNTYNYIKNTLGVSPELYGVELPTTECKECGQPIPPK
jgi:hypothetical protein